MFDGIFEAISDTIRSILFGPLHAVLGWIINIVDIILTEISGFSFINLPFVSACYETCLTMALVILPLKLVYEWVWLVISNDVEKWSLKIFAVFQIVVVLLATPPVLTMVGNGVSQINQAILAGDVVDGESSASGKDAGEGFALTMLVATTGMDSEEAKVFMEDFTSENFDINIRDEDNNYIYDFDFIMPMFVGLAMWIIIFFIGLQMASRQVSLAFFKIITPLCALSLTNKENPTAFTVWKNNIIGPFLMNTVQIFLFLFMFKLIDELGTNTSGIAKLLFTIALLLVIISIPNKVAAMIGGYNAGIMEGLSSMQSILMMASSGLSTSKAIGSGAKAVGGAVKAGASLLTHSPNSVARMTGSAASRIGRVNDSIQRSADHVKNAMKYGNGVGGAAAILGGTVLDAAKDKVKQQAGGLGNEFKRSKREADIKTAFSKNSPYVMRDSHPSGSTSSRESELKNNSMAQKESQDGIKQSILKSGNAQKDQKFDKINTTNRLNKARNDKERRLK